MEAGTAAAFNGRHRQQLLNDGMPAPGGPIATHQQFQQRQQQPFDPGSRKASMTSQTARRFFRRNKNPDAAFDDEMGADIQDLTGSSVSFDDISHIRNRGPYGLGATDSTPIIPTLGAGLSSGRSVNNIQYRKQMNHNMKMNLANGARAMSLAGANPMDPRTMSMGTVPRTMSLNPNGPVDPRAMSMRQQGPRAMSMKSQAGPYPQNRAMSLSSQRAMSLSAQSALGPQMPMQPQVGPQMGPQPYGFNRQPMNPKQFQQMQMQQQHQFQMQQQQFQMQQQQFQQQQQMQPQFQSMQQPYQQQPQFGQPDQYQSLNPALSPSVQPPKPLQSTESSIYDNSVPTSSESLTNVPEEDEEYKSLRPESPDEDAVIYKFEGDDQDNMSVSRKSTLKKTNSMRLRKLNLFGAEPKAHIDEEAHTSGSDLPSPNVADYNSDAKGAPSHKSPLNNEFDDYIDEDTDRKYLPKQRSQKSLTQNTAFHNFRSSSSLQKITTNDNDPHSFNSDDLNEVPNEIDPPQELEPKKLHPETGYMRSNHSSDKSNSTDGDNLNSTPPTTNTSEYSNSTVQVDGIDTNDDESDIFQTKKTIVASPSIGDFDDASELDSKKEIRGSKSFSISGKSKNLLKRLSKSSRRSSTTFDEAPDVTNKRSSVASQSSLSQRRLSSQSKTPVVFTKEELGIMTANNDLLNELELVTTELASSIRRELNLESRIKNSNIGSHSNHDYETEIRSKSKAISDLEERLTKERRLRFISEEHALLLESGQSPSPLKLNYEKTELYRQLLIKNDLVNQLQDKLSEYESKDEKNDKDEKSDDPNLLEKYNELLRENANLKFKIIPDMEKQLESKSEHDTSYRHGLDSSPQKPLSLISHNDSYIDDEINQSQDQIEILTLKSQRDELREIIMKLNSSHNYEMKMAADKLKKYEMKMNEQVDLNDKLRQRLGVNTSASSASNVLNKGGKLQGLSIVSPNNTLFDD